MDSIEFPTMNKYKLENIKIGEERNWKKIKKQILIIDPTSLKKKKITYTHCKL